MTRDPNITRKDLKTLSYFEHNEARGKEDPVGDVIPFKRDEDLTVEHADASTIVEKIEMTPELKKAFEDAGYDMEDVG